MQRRGSRRPGCRVSFSFGQAKKRTADVWGRKAASGSLMVLYCHASFVAKAGANGLCGFFAIIDMLSKTGFGH